MEALERMHCTERDVGWWVAAGWFPAPLRAARCGLPRTVTAGHGMGKIVGVRCVCRMTWMAIGYRCLITARPGLVALPCRRGESNLGKVAGVWKQYA